MSPGESAKYQNNEKKWESLLRISEEAHTATNIEEFVATIHGILAELVMARNFFICLHDESTDKYFFPYFKDEFDSIETAGANFDYDESLEVTMYDLSGTLTDYVRRSGKPVRFPNEEMNKLYQSGEIKLFGSQSTSWLGVPLKLAGKTFGVMAVQCYDRTDAYSSADEELMVFVSDHIARAIENVRAEEKIRKQHQLVLQQKQAITDSISYAKRIQKAVLPSPLYLDNILSDHFTIFKPKDIISGDFYWAREIEGYKVVIVADCTGHGVPGALMSMLGVTLLNEQFRTFGIRQPGEILGHLRTKVKEILAQEGSTSDQKDGMDMAIAIMDRENHELQFAGANIPLILIRMKEHQGDMESDMKLSMENENYQLYRVKADKQPIGVHWEEKDFSTRVVKLKERDSLYMYSDGYLDQYGGNDRKKFKSRRLKKLLLSLQEAPMEMQKRLLEDAFDKWRGSHEQIDDVCMLGIRI
ncbi:MAG: SpoIIE family protein phosphatase [Bacteroidales bacterium]|nr:SpoIIE family protein phosphatase [Bacteroidales bacterium]